MVEGEHIRYGIHGQMIANCVCRIWDQNAGLRGAGAMIVKEAKLNCQYKKEFIELEDRKAVW
jgi:hypothetical protein